MKNCQTLNGLLKAMEKKEACCLKYTSKAQTSNGYIIYQENGTNLIVTDETHEKIKAYLLLV